MRKPKIFISYHRADKKYKDRTLEILESYGYRYYCVDENQSFNGWKHQRIADHICSMMEEIGRAHV